MEIGRLEEQRQQYMGREIEWGGGNIVWTEE